ncbi:LOW QUALITY PROTEIN: hypothetical protein PHMEG_0007295 [Phytophthora megakarya]|uniref:PiggyBac transposable element-derived protein domain-containing protein n=1 Tax=Phytophthora megakarya TaxID=4795 RepID=A0A225WLZ3_9STRA|nr:LOW QUALITY PROTEIN: hypothetical protein PHMEG_0007295 [Phytophthora megakarya]
MDVEKADWIVKRQPLHVTGGKRKMPTVGLPEAAHLLLAQEELRMGYPSQWRHYHSKALRGSAVEPLRSNDTGVTLSSAGMIQNDLFKTMSMSNHGAQRVYDINTAGATENPGEFGGLVSDVENDDSVSESSGRGDDLETASEGAGEGDLVDLFDNSLLDAGGGVAGISSGSIHGNILKDMEVHGWSNPVSYSQFPFLDEPYEARPDGSLLKTTHNYMLYDPTLRAQEAASTASGAFLFFVRPQLWEDIAEASNEYFEDKLDERVKEQYAKQVTREKKARIQKRTEEVIRAGLLQTPSITGRELCNFVGLLIARAVVPNKEKMKTNGRQQAKQRDPRTASDRAWKLRPVIESLQDRFQAGYTPPPVMVFDEAMLPSRSSFNRMRVYIEDNPHKWGTKLFMLCCSQYAYCMRMSRFEVYCGKQQSSQDTVTTDTNAGPAAVVRNLITILASNGTSEKRLVVMDRFYTSPSLAMQLRTLGFYSIGTVMTNRRGFCEAIVEKKEKRPAGVHRGEFVVAENKQVPCIKAVCWWDNRPVHLLAAGDSVKQDRVVRCEKSGELSYPRILMDYQTFMGGVDVHDQLSIQRYSLRLALKYKKYYKPLFLGFLDIAVVNAFIVYNSRRATEGKNKLTHVMFLKQLHQELVQLQEGDWAAVRRMQATPTKNRGARMQRVHIPIQVDEWRKGKQGRKCRQRACKVCSVLKWVIEAKGGETTFYYSTCKLHSSSKKVIATRVYLCNKVKHTHNNEAGSCFEIWHRHWRYGTLLPPSQRKKKIRA